MKLLMTVLLLSLPIVVQATEPDPDPWFQRQAEGWFWYIDPPAEEDAFEASAQPQQSPAIIAAFNPKAELEAFQKQLENTQALAIMHPSHENVMAYLYLQKQAMDRSQAFSETWQRVLWATPALDHTLVRPTSPKAVNAYYDTRNENRRVKLQQLAQTHGLFYFFRQRCPYCKQFSPILKSVAKRHGFHITAITLDGGTTPGFPNPRRDNGTARRLGVQTVPAVYLIEPRSRSIQAVSFSLLGPTELEERIIALMNANAGGSL